MRVEYTPSRLLTIAVEWGVGGAMSHYLRDVGQGTVETRL